MLNSRSFLVYIIACSISIFVVCIFAYVQYHLVLDLTLNITNYYIPFIVGLIFGFLIARNLILVHQIKKERDIIIEKNSKIRSFTSTIVHDLKSPVAAIHSLTELILEGEIDCNDETKEYINMIQSSSADILENITLILDKTKMESGIEPDHMEIGNPYYTIQSVIDKYVVTALQKSISIQRLIDKNLPDVEYDKNALDHILYNLISNAIKYSPAHTQVKIYSELLTDRLKIVVEDQGLGMTEEDISNAFDEFKTLSARPTGNETSTGLGLAIVKQLLEQLGGSIKIKSEGKDKGSSFEFTLKIS